MAENNKFNKGDNKIDIARSSSNRRRGEASATLSIISIDSQSFVNLGQLMGSRGHNAAASGMHASTVASNSNSNLGTSSSFLSSGGSDSDPDGLRDFDQIFHPTASTSSVGSWSGQELRADAEDVEVEEGRIHEHEDDDSDSLLPALPRSPSPGSPTGSDRYGLFAASNKRPFSGNELGEASWLGDGQGEGTKAAATEVGSDDDGRGSTAGSERALFPSARHPTRSADSSGFDLGSCEMSEFSEPAAPKVISADNAAYYTSDDDRAESKVQDEEDESEQPSAPLLGATAAAEDTPAGGALSAGGSPSSLRESWLHVPIDHSKNLDGVGGGTLEGDACRIGADSPEVVTGDEDGANTIGKGKNLKTGHGGSGGARGECGCCFACGLDRAVALAKDKLLHLAELAKGSLEVGAEACVKAQEACSKGQGAVIKATDSVPQAPVRVWLGRIAGSLVLGAILGGVTAYYGFPRVAPASISCSALSSSYTFEAGSGDTTFGRTAWSTPGTQHHQNQHHHKQDQQQQQQRDAAAGAEQNFGDRLNNALFAARAGEAAAQQALLEEIRKILAATGKSGGISAEQLLRQFNAKRFAEASKAWSAAEGVLDGDPLFYMPPNKPPPSTPHMSSEQRTQQEQKKEQQQQQQEPDNASSQSNETSRVKVEEKQEKVECPEGEVYRQVFKKGNSVRVGACVKPHVDGTPSTGSRGAAKRTCRGGGWVC